MISRKQKRLFAGNRRTFDEDWLIHDDCSEWWYATGYVHDEEGRLLSFQLIIVRQKINGIPGHPCITMCAVTDFESGRHHYSQDFSMMPFSARVTENTASYKDTVLFEKRESCMRVAVKGDDFAFNLDMDYGKGAFWHCDDGLLVMGEGGPSELTYYYSYTNMPTQGTITLDGKTVQVSGKGWFDKQGGTYNGIDPRTHWEWFSLRFFDDEEMMLFYFPQSGRRDGTRITAEGETQRIRDYEIEVASYVYPNGDDLRFSSGWNLTIPGFRGEKFELRPLLDGMLNIGYFELLAEIIDSEGETVGMCFVELLPGARNEKGTGIDLLLKKTGK